ncbi:MAG: FapA family protein [Leptospiraceae bacterium]|nr:FapA family protein [Leptospiraceae bacterium]MDW8305470.1 FapA family protein [Leptospiraceae bacterium]
MSYAENLYRELEEKRNGFFALEEKEGKAFLTVHPPGSKGKAVEISDVLARLKLLQIEPYSLDLIKEVVARARGEPTEIGLWPVRQKQNARAEVEISPDGMQAHIKLYPPIKGGEALSKDQISQALTEAGVRQGIFWDVVERLGQQNEYHRWFLIAEGKLPRAGRDGYLKTMWDELRQGPQELPGGRVDHRELGIIRSVTKGTIIAEIIPPESGEDGYDVTGKLLAASQGKGAQFELGPNVSLSEDGRKILSNIDGLPVIDSNNKIRVDEILYLKKVDYSTGNINFLGTIVVEEKVADGFVLKTPGSVLIKQSVGKIFIQAGGDVTLLGGFMGRGEGKIEAAGDIRARFVEQGKLVAGQSIYLSDAALYSFLVAKEKIVVKGRRGEIIGGEVIAGQSVVCEKAGAVVEAKTRITVGTPPEILMALEALQNEILQKKGLLTKIENTVRILEDKKLRQHISEKEEETRRKLTDLKEKFRAELASLEMQLENALSSFEPQKGCFVLIQRETYPNVEIHFGKSKFWRSGLRPISSRLAIYLNRDMQISVGSELPDFYEI